MSARILVVDDEPDLLELVRFNLSQAGFRVETAASGREALEQLRRSPPDLMVLDLMLPDVSGNDICRQVRSDPALADLPILMLTAKSEEVDRVVGFELGADDYVPKPFSPRELTPARPCGAAPARDERRSGRRPRARGAAGRSGAAPLLRGGRGGGAHGEGVPAAHHAHDPAGPGADTGASAR